MFQTHPSPPPSSTTVFSTPPTLSLPVTHHLPPFLLLPRSPPPSNCHSPHHHHQLPHQQSTCPQPQPQRLGFPAPLPQHPAIPPPPPTCHVSHYHNPAFISITTPLTQHNAPKPLLPVRQHHSDFHYQHNLSTSSHKPPMHITPRPPLPAGGPPNTHPHNTGAGQPPACHSSGTPGTPRVPTRRNARTPPSARGSDSCHTCSPPSRPALSPRTSTDASARAPSPNRPRSPLPALAPSPPPPCPPACASSRTPRRAKTAPPFPRPVPRPLLSHPPPRPRPTLARTKCSATARSPTGTWPRHIQPLSPASRARTRTTSPSPFRLPLPPPHPTGMLGIPPPYQSPSRTGPRSAALPHRPRPCNQTSSTSRCDDRRRPAARTTPRTHNYRRRWAACSKKAWRPRGGVSLSLSRSLALSLSLSLSLSLYIYIYIYIYLAHKLPIVSLSADGCHHRRRPAPYPAPSQKLAPISPTTPLSTLPRPLPSFAPRATQQPAILRTTPRRTRTAKTTSCAYPKPPQPQQIQRRAASRPTALRPVRKPTRLHQTARRRPISACCHPLAPATMCLQAEPAAQPPPDSPRKTRLRINSSMRPASCTSPSAAWACDVARPRTPATPPRHPNTLRDDAAAAARIQAGQCGRTLPTGVLAGLLSFSPPPSVESDVVTQQQVSAGLPPEWL
uniref:Uncharacterized protein n=1 Tax=Physcomitrium patens TaxID=3218 RepID=A0A2K1IUA4_PHYPA|nr:hypothetical protein PHYPA_024804 [Physcomitrium patens]